MPGQPVCVSAIKPERGSRVLRRWLAGLSALALMAVSSVALADDREAAILDVAADALFHLDVTGKLASAPDRIEARHGKAFAVAPNILLTSSHVIGDYEEWLALTDKKVNGENLPAAVRRAARPINRILRITGVNAFSDGTDQVIPHSTPSKSVDAASLTVSMRDAPLEKWFSLSLCPIEPEQEYFTLLSTSATPEDAGSIDADKLKLFKLTTVGYNPSEFGSLFAFTLDNQAPRANFRDWGHAGSPIFDAERNVVAFVSAFIVHKGDDTILATPIQPIVPGTSRLLASAPVSQSNTALSCSLSNTVKEISNDVASHADWSIFIPRDEEGKVKGDIRLSYRSVSETPNIESIDVEYFFIGRAQENSLRDTEIPLAGGSEPIKDPIAHTRNDKRLFALDHLYIEGIKIEGQTKLQEDGGFITDVDLMITPNLRDGRQGRRATFSFPWVEEYVR